MIDKKQLEAFKLMLPQYMQNPGFAKTIEGVQKRWESLSEEDRQKWLSESEAQYNKLVDEREARERAEQESLNCHRVYELWMEGYAATGESASAQYLGSVEADSFKEAVIERMKTYPQSKEYFDKKELTYWGCHIYDSESNARRNFG